MNKLSIPHDIEYLIGTFVGNINMSLIYKSFNLAYKEIRDKAIIKIQKFFKFVMKKPRCRCCGYIRHITHQTPDKLPFCEECAYHELCRSCHTWCGAYLCSYCKRMRLYK